MGNQVSTWGRTARCVPSAAHTGPAHVAVADHVLGEPAPRLRPGPDLEAQATFPACAQQGSVAGMVVVHDRHHARDGEQLGPAGRFKLAP